MAPSDMFPKREPVRVSYALKENVLKPSMRRSPCKETDKKEPCRDPQRYSYWEGEEET